MDMQTANGKYIQVESHMLMEDATPTTTIKSPLTLTSDQTPAGGGNYYKNQKLTIPPHATYLAVQADKDLYFGASAADLDPLGTTKRKKIKASDYDYLIPVAGLPEIWLRFADASNSAQATIYFSFIIV